MSGQGSIDPETGKKVSGGITEKTRQLLENFGNILGAADLGLDNVVKVGVFLRDIEDFPAMNEVYREYFRSDPPARTTVQAQLPGNIEVGIYAIAYVNERKSLKSTFVGNPEQQEQKEIDRFFCRDAETAVRHINEKG